jgi:hypothetical protein
MIPWGEQVAMNSLCASADQKYKAYFPDSIQYWHDMMAHPNYDDFWKAPIPPSSDNIRPL